MQFEEQYRGKDHFLSASSSSRHETTVGDTLSRGSSLGFVLGVSGDTIVS
jgi:hypothetical protein